MPPATGRLHLGYRDGLLTLAFGGVMDGTTVDGPTPEATTIATRRFADDLRMLVAAGYHTVSPAQVAAWHAGRAGLPANALLLTFDGGRMDTTLNAAPIVHRLQLKATVFMIGGAYRQAPVFYASPDQLRSLEHQGWSIEAHAVSGHGSVAVGHGHRLPYLSARQVSGGTRETLPAFTTRVGQDYRDAKIAAEKVSSAPVIAFSWPFGAYGADHRTNDPRTARINLGLARSQYALGFNDDGQETYRLAGRVGRPAAHQPPARRSDADAARPLRAHRARHRRLGIDRASRMRRLIVLVGAAAVIAGGTAVALASHEGAARAALPAARQSSLQVIAFTEARPTAPARGSLSAHLSSLTAISPAWLSLGPNGTIAYRDADAFSRGLTGRGAGLLPVLRDPGAPDRGRARRTPRRASARPSASP